MTSSRCRTASCDSKVPGVTRRTWISMASRINDIVSTMASKGIYSDPTMVAFEGLYVPENGDLSPAYSPFVGTLPPSTERSFRTGGFAVPKDLTRAHYRASWAKMVGAARQDAQSRRADRRRHRRRGHRARPRARDLRRSGHDAGRGARDRDARAGQAGRAGRRRPARSRRARRRISCSSKATRRSASATCATRASSCSAASCSTPMRCAPRRGSPAGLSRCEAMRFGLKFYRAAAVCSVLSA